MRYAQGLETYVKKLNKFHDLTHQEFVASHTGFKSNRHSRSAVDSSVKLEAVATTTTKNVAPTRQITTKPHTTQKLTTIKTTTKKPATTTKTTTKKPTTTTKTTTTTQYTITYLLDWRQVEGMLQPIKNQGECGSVLKD